MPSRVQFVLERQMYIQAERGSLVNFPAPYDALLSTFCSLLVHQSYARFKRQIHYNYNIIFDITYSLKAMKSLTSCCIDATPRCVNENSFWKSSWFPANSFDQLIFTNELKLQQRLLAVWLHTVMKFFYDSEMSRRETLKTVLTRIAWPWSSDPATAWNKKV